MSDTNMGEEKMFIALAGIGSIFGFILPLVAWLLKKDSFSAYHVKIQNTGIACLMGSTAFCFFIQFR